MRFRSEEIIKGGNMFKILWKLILPIAVVGVIVFITWVNVKYWNSDPINIPDWASKIMFH